MKSFLVLFFLLSGLFSFSQCNNHHQEACELPFDWPYEFDSQSISRGTFPGKAFYFKVILYENKDYYIGFCKPQNYSFENTHFKITIDDTELDNSYATQENENLMSFELSNDEPRFIIIEIKLDKMQPISYTQADLKCLGVIIGSKETEETY